MTPSLIVKCYYHGDEHYDDDYHKTSYSQWRWLPLNVWNSAKICHLWHCTAKQSEVLWQLQESFLRKHVVFTFSKMMDKFHLLCRTNRRTIQRLWGLESGCIKYIKATDARVAQFHLGATAVAWAGGWGQMLRAGTMLRSATMLPCYNAIGQQQALNRKRRLGPSWLSTMLYAGHN